MREQLTSGKLEAKPRSAEGGGSGHDDTQTKAHEEQKENEEMPIEKKGGKYIYVHDK